MKYREFWLSGLNVTTETGQQFRIAATYPVGTIIGEYIQVIEKQAYINAINEYADMKKRCKCGDIILADTVDKCEALEKKLNISIEALEVIAEEINYYETVNLRTPTHGATVAKNAIRMIKEIK